MKTTTTITVSKKPTWSDYKMQFFATALFGLMLGLLLSQIGHRMEHKQMNIRVVTCDGEVHRYSAPWEFPQIDVCGAIKQTTPNG